MANGNKRVDEFRDHVIYRFPKRHRVVIQTRFWLSATVAALLAVVVGLMFLSAAFAQMPQQQPRPAPETFTDAQLFREQRDISQKQLADVQVALFLAQQQHAADEAQKATLIEWLIAAQGAAKPQ